MVEFADQTNLSKFKVQIISTLAAVDPYITEAFFERQVSLHVLVNIIAKTEPIYSVSLLLR